MSVKRDIAVLRQEFHLFIQQPELQWFAAEGSSENIQREMYHVLRRLKVLRLRSITKCQASSLAGLGKSVTQFDFSFAVAVWSGVNIAGVNLKDLNPGMGGKDDPEKWEDIHKKVINR